MKKYSWLSPVLILIFVLGTLIFLSPLFVPDSVTNWPIKKKLNLGLDLRGGIQIVLGLDTKGLTAAEIPDAVDSNIEIIRNRIDQFGVAEPTIQKIGEDRIVVQLPGAKDRTGAEDLVKRTAMLNFKLVATADEAQSVVTQIDDIIKTNPSMFPELIELERRENAELKKRGIEADSMASQNGMFKRLLVSADNTFSVSKNDVPVLQKLFADSLFASLVPKGYEFAFGSTGRNVKEAVDNRQLYVLKSAVQVSGSDLEKAKMMIGSSQDPNPQTANKPYISLEFNRTGARLFERVTADNTGKQLAIVVDSLVYSAPNIQDRIPDGKAIITGIFTREEARSLAILLDQGSLKAPLIVESTSAVGASLGADSIKKGLRAGLIGISIVILIMLFYYKLSGLIADFVLVFNVGFILAAMTLFGGTLTLPGIAGIVLTIGMAVDANVLIFERIREELDAGKTPRSAVATGFDRASVTIWDSQITTLIAAFVLYQFGTGAVRGFALTLTIGVIGSIFCAIVFVRYIMEKTMLSGDKKTLSI